MVNLIETQYELDAANLHREEIRRAVAAFRLSSSLATAPRPGLRARFDAAVVRLSEGATRRHAARVGTPPGPREPASG